MRGDVPEGLKDRTVFSLDMTALMGRRQYRGEFEERASRRLNEIKAAEGRILAYIDEIHTIVGAGQDRRLHRRGQHAQAHARARRAALHRHHPRRGYRMEKDAALGGDFQPVQVDPPSVEDTVSILRGLKGASSATTTSIGTPRWSPPPCSRTATCRTAQLPDKAIDLLDEACALDPHRDGLHARRARRDHRRVTRLQIEETALKKEEDHASKLLDELRKSSPTSRRRRTP